MPESKGFPYRLDFPIASELSDWTKDVWMGGGCETPHSLVFTFLYEAILSYLMCEASLIYDLYEIVKMAEESEFLQVDNLPAIAFKVKCFERFRLWY